MVGEKLLHYHIQDRIGDGAMGVLYRAQDTRLNRVVALKFLTPGAGDKGARERLLREARASSALDHPNICTIYDVAEARDGNIFIVMQYCEGAPLADRIARGPLPIEEAVSIAMQAASGLGRAHAGQIVHRDIKPSNLMVTTDGTVKIVDFGIAKARDPGTSDLHAAFGTPAYMSPEQVRGEPVDARTDIWSLGVVLYEMLTGRRPFRADYPAAMLYMIACETHLDARELRGDVSSALNAVVNRAMEKEPSARFASMEDFLHALRSATAPARAGEAEPASVTGDTLMRAREASQRFDWPTAFEAYADLDARGTLGTDDLVQYAQTALWVSKPAVMRELWARAHAAYLKDGRTTDAATVAIQIAEDFHDRGQSSVANGWLRRAEALLEGAPESLAHGYLARMRTRMAFKSRDLDAADRFATEAMRFADRFGSADLRALALQDRGRILVYRHRIAEGMSLLDEAMVSAVAGELSPGTIGRAYCNVISTCEQIGDYRRAGEWSNQAVHWCSPHRESPFPGLCSVHRAEIMHARGAWTDAQEQAERAAATHMEWELGVASQAFYVVGVIRLRRHQLDAAEEAFQRAHEMGYPPVPGLALLRVRQGRVETARALIQAALADAPAHPLDRVRLLPSAVTILVAAKEFEGARTHAAELESIAGMLESPMFSAQAESAWGAIALESGDTDSAFTRLRNALKLWRQAEMPYEEATVRAKLARAYHLQGDNDHALLEAQAARSIFVRLGAEGDVPMVDDVLKLLSSRGAPA